MNTMTFRHTRVAAAVAGALLSLATGHALGSAFALQEQNASGLGHAYAGGAAADDVLFVRVVAVGAAAPAGAPDAASFGVAPRDVGTGVGAG